MKKLTWYDAAALVIWALPIIYLATIYSSLPPKVPLHFGADGKADAYGPPSQLILLACILAGVTLATYVVLKFLPQIDPKQMAKYSANTFIKIGLGIVLFISAISIVILYSSAHEGVVVTDLLYPLLGVFFAFMGNVMNNIKPNYFAGIRTPWTLESEDTWRATHRLAAKMWFVGGILLAIITFILSGTAASTVFIAGILILALVPMAYSFIYSKKHQLKA